jgi:agmatine deiminase
MTAAPETPRAAGYRMPGEFSPHEACWMFWPCLPVTWGETSPTGRPGLAAARSAYAEVARAIARFEPLRMAAPPAHAAAAAAACGDDVEVLELPIDDAWARDTGPSFLLGPAGELGGVHWRFNNYGNEPFAGKPALAPEAYAGDAAIGGVILELEDARAFRAPLVMEGGALHVDGEGTVLVTEECLLHPNRNPTLDRATIEDHLLAFLGAEKVIWLGRGLVDDETNGHIDELACFVRPGVVLALSRSDPADVDYPALQDNLDRLAGATDARGRSLEIIEIEAAPAVMHRGVRLSLSYINCYLANGGVVMPAFDAPDHDAEAAAIMARAFPDREIVQVPALDIFGGGGGIHCITQQQPSREARR